MFLISFSKDELADLPLGVQKRVNGRPTSVRLDGDFLVYQSNGDPAVPDGENRCQIFHCEEDDGYVSLFCHSDPRSQDVSEQIDLLIL